MINIQNEIFEKVASSLDIPESYYLKAVDRYKSVGRWLARTESMLRRAKQHIYPQGSFRLGTMIRPINGRDEYDIDLVCEISLPKSKITQRDLKSNVGEEISGYAKSHGMVTMPRDGRRCWTLKYSDEADFHMDILPSIPDADYFIEVMRKSASYDVESMDTAIAITDKMDSNYSVLSPDWPVSNPMGYALWFENKMAEQFQIKKAMLAEKMKAKLDEVPNYKIKTALQRAIQLLKRHRDGLFQNDSENKPISIIITTLAAQSYNGEPDISESLVHIVQNMDQFILSIDGTDWIPNPVNPQENFADKWQEKPIRKRNFYAWLEQAKSAFAGGSPLTSAEQVYKNYSPHLGEEIMMKSLAALESLKGTSPPIFIQKKAQSAFDVPHRDPLAWPERKQYSVIIVGYYNIHKRGKSGEQWVRFKSDGASMIKNHDLKFKLDTDTPKPYEVYWQVVNTGEEAANLNGLRGSIFRSTSNSGDLHTQTEFTSYSGMHWIECFIVKEGICIARSGEFVVNIR